MPATDVVMISVDDLISIDRFRNAFGVEIHTPNFDRLKAEGVSFSNAYASTALCNPSRTSIMTGQNPYETGVHFNAETWHERVDPSTTIPAILKAAGYQTHGFGKTFHTIQIPQAVADQMFDSYYSPTAEQYLLSNDFEFPVGVWDGDPDALGDALATAAAIEALEHAGPDPLLLMMGLVDPHGPFITPPSFRSFYPIEDIVVPEWDGDNPPDFIVPFLNGELLDEFEAAGIMPELIQSYLANISEMDFRLGQLLDAIDASGRNPAIVLFGDHGFSLGDHDTIGKFTLWEQAGAAPLIIVHPDMAPGDRGVVYDGVVSLLDIAPTILDIAGVAIPSYMEGQSLLPVALDGSQPVLGEAVTTMAGSFSLRTDDFRYTRYEDGSVELFQISTDPENKVNLHGEPAFAAIEADLASRLADKLVDMGVDYDAATGTTVFETPTGDTQYFLADASLLSSLSDSGGDDVAYSGTPNILMPNWLEGFIGMSHLDYSIAGNAKANFISGNVSDDTIRGAGGNDRLVGFLGDDVIYGQNGGDRVVGADGEDSIFAGNGNDTLFGGDGADAVRGGNDHDEVSGQVGADRLFGEDGHDTLTGGADADLLTGGDGNDRLHGGGGADRFFFSSADSGSDTIVDFTLDADVIRLSGMTEAEVTISQLGNNTIISFDSETIRLIGVTGITHDDLTFT